MDENQNENENSSNESTETENQGTTLTVDDYNKLLKEKQDLEEANKKLYARVKKSSDNKPLVETHVNPELTTEITRLKLKVDHNITDPEAIDFVMRNGGEEALKNPYITQALDGMAKQKKAEQAVIDDEAGGSTTTKRQTLSQLKDMSVEELEKTLPHA